MRPLAVALATGMLAGAAGFASAAAAAAPSDAGRKIYEKHCSQCHGEKGDGAGAATPHLLPKPRDFTTGKFKLRSTPSGALPTDEDLKRVIRTGMPYTSMPAWPNLSDGEVASLVAYVKGFYGGFADPSQAAKPIELPPAPAWSKQSAEKGKQLYASLGCGRCHGEAGRGEGPSAPTLKDDQGHPLRAADLSYRWTFRGGPRREDIFRTFSTGLNGTPMPSYFDSLKPEERWALTDYVYSLGDGDAPGYASLVVASPVDDVDAARGAALFDAAAPARFPVVGQIMEPGRAFAPSATAVEVRAVFDEQRIALLVRWHDMRADTTGKCSPALAVPVEEEGLAAEKPQPEGEGSDFWGEAQKPAAGAAEDPFAETDAAPAQTASEFSDAVAVQLPAKLSDGIAKPYFLFGDAQRPVDLWFLDLAQKRVRSFVGQGSGSLTPGEGSEVAASASYAAGEWSAVFVRDLRAPGGVSFTEGSYVPLAFSLWDGSARERGSRRGLTQWVYLYVAPREKPSLAGPAAATGLGVLGVELVAIFWIRRKARGRGAPAGL